jgi:nitrogen fixation/metabolism regulation signal transduction histidine kinase
VTLRHRLLVAFLLFALVPTAVVTLVARDQLSRAIGRWYRPGVERALDSALEVTKGAVARLESTALLKASDWARQWPARPISDAERARLRATLQSTGLDFIQLYRRDGGRWRRVEQLLPEGVLVTEGPDFSAEIGDSAATGHVLRSPQGALAAVAATPSGAALVTGYWVSPDYFTQLEQVGQGTSYYRQLGVYVDLQRSVVLILFGAVALVLVVLAVVLSARFAGQMSAPLGELSRAIERVSAGELSVRVSPRGATEVRSLGDSFNRMTARLEAARSALREAEREAAWRDVARKLAHEFKNTLTPIQLSLQLLQCEAEAAPAETRAEMTRNLDAALREVEGLERLASQFSQFARLPEPRLEPVTGAELAAGAAALMPNAPVHVSVADETGALDADRTLITRALHNLLLNAAEASAPDRPIELAVAGDADRVRFEVRDRGSGLAPEVRGRLFEPYASTKRRGSGLGLSLVRDIARQHGGAIQLEDRAGGGVTATLVLPRHPGVTGHPAPTTG